jgi:putative thiamine transport system ATP-binding protein
MNRGMRVQDLRLTLGGNALLVLPSLTIEPGEIVTFMGPSGCGKSSLLAWLSGGLARAFQASGRIWLDDEEVTRLPAHRRRIGILFQDDLLFPHLSVAENLTYGLRPDIRGRSARRAQIEAALAEAELAGFGERDPATLSGGQRARVALMRTLLAEPRALLLDEAFGKLDVALRERMRRFVFDRTTRLMLPTLMVTHDPEDARSAGGRVLHFGPPGIAAGTLHVGRAVRQEEILPLAADGTTGWVGGDDDRPA